MAKMKFDKTDFKEFSLPLSEEDVLSLRAGDYVLLSGVLYTGRDAAHKRIYERIKNGLPIPAALKGEAVYYVGPCFDERGKVIGAGPTTAMRMDAYAPLLYDNGIKISIGKGDRGENVRKAIKRNGGLYLCAIGGAGALYAEAVKDWEIAAYADLGTEAVHRLTIAGFPVIVGIDAYGNSIFRR